jgi:AcrR family transcriptional regulator
MRATSASRPRRRAARADAALTVQPRGEAVVEKILERAMSVFLKQGFDGTSIDVLARETNTSKATIYRYFPDKEALFTAIVDRALKRFRRFPEVQRCRMTSGRDLLTDLAHQYLDLMLDPDRIELSRVYVFEIGKFAELERLFARSDERDGQGLVQLFRDVAATGLVDIADPARAGESFWGLVVAPAFVHRLFRPRTRVSEALVTKYVDGAVTEFLRLYPALH